MHARCDWIHADILLIRLYLSTASYGDTRPLSKRSWQLLDFIGTQTEINIKELKEADPHWGYGDEADAFLYGMFDAFWNVTMLAREKWLIRSGP